MCCFIDTKSLYWQNVIFFFSKPSFYLLSKCLKLRSCWIKCFGYTGLRVTVLGHDRILTVQRRNSLYLLTVIQWSQKGSSKRKKNPLCLCMCVRQNLQHSCVLFVCAWFFFSPSVQPDSEIPRSVNSLSVNMAGGLTFPLPMGSILKKSQWTTSSWPSRWSSNSYKIKKN